MARKKVARPMMAEIIDPTPERRDVGGRPALKDPLEEAAEYIALKWFQQLVAIRTNCFRCGANSPIIHAPHGTIAFGNLVNRNEVDVTEHVVIEFAQIGWKFQKRKSYCPVCKNLGAI